MLLNIQNIAMFWILNFVALFVLIILSGYLLPCLLSMKDTYLGFINATSGQLCRWGHWMLLFCVVLCHFMYQQTIPTFIFHQISESFSLPDSKRFSDVYLNKWINVYIFIPSGTYSAIRCMTIHKVCASRHWGVQLRHPLKPFQSQGNN